MKTQKKIKIKKPHKTREWNRTSIRKKCGLVIFQARTFIICDLQCANQYIIASYGN